MNGLLRWYTNAPVHRYRHWVIQGRQCNRLDLKTFLIVYWLLYYLAHLWPSLIRTILILLHSSVSCTPAAKLPLVILRCWRKPDVWVQITPRKFQSIYSAQNERYLIHHHHQQLERWSKRYTHPLCCCETTLPYNHGCMVTLHPWCLIFCLLLFSYFLDADMTDSFVILITLTDTDALFLYLVKGLIKETQNKNPLDDPCSRKNNHAP